MHAGLSFGFFGNVMMLLKELDVICTAFEVAIFMFPSLVLVIAVVRT